MWIALSSPQIAAQEQQFASKSYNIPIQSADAALIEFAKQANITIVFPYEKVQNITTNSLNGDYSTEDALNLLLSNTGLVAKFNKKGTVSIFSTTKAEPQKTSIWDNVAKLFTEQGEKLVVTPKPIQSKIEFIEVRGIRASVMRALDVKYNQFGVIDTIQSEEIGKFPDLNLAESLQRITGVSIDRSEGEGQFVTVRGFGPEFNTVFVNGRKLPTDNLGREFSFDTLPSELVSGVSVNKTVNASDITGGIGSTINIETARPRRNDGFNISGHVKALYDTNSRETSPQLAVVASNSNNVFGWLVALSHQKRKARIEEAEIDGWLLNTRVPASELTNTATNLFVPRNYDQRVRFDTRTRDSGTIVLQYSPNSDLEVTADFLYSSFEVETDSTSIGHWFTSPNLEDVITDNNGTVIEFSQNVGHATDFHARTFNRPSRLNALGINADWQVSPSLKFNADIGFAKARIEDTQGAANALTLIGYLNRSSFYHGSGDTLPHIFGFQEADASIVNAEGNVAGVSHYLDPANGRAHVMLRRGWQIDDDALQFRLDGEWHSELRSASIDLKFGLSLNQHEKANNRWDNEKNAVHCTYCGYFNEPDIPDSFQTVFSAGEGFLSSISGHEQIPNTWLRHDGSQIVEYLESVGDTSFGPVLRDNSYSVKEQTVGMYSEVLIANSIGSIHFETQLGIRYDQTDVLVDGFSSELLRLDILDQTELSPITGPSEAVSFSEKDDHWLPSLVSQWRISDELILRMGVSKSITRPTLTQLSPSLTYDTTRQGGDLRASQGSPTLKPFKSTNYDLSLEWYSNEHHFGSLAYFRKSVKNFIVSQVDQVSFNNVVDPSTGTDPLGPDAGDDIAVFDVTRPINGETAIVEGVELSYQYHFESGFGFLANMTLIDSNAELDKDNINQKFALTGLSDTQNLIIFYDKVPLQIRFAWNSRSEFVQSLIQRQSAEPTFVDNYSQIDMSASYQLTPTLNLFIEGINITEESVIKHGRYNNQLLLAQSPGARYTLGLRGFF